MFKMSWFLLRYSNFVNDMSLSILKKTLWEIVLCRNKGENEANKVMSEKDVGIKEKPIALFVGT